MGRSEAVAGADRLQFLLFRCVAASVADMDDGQFIAHDAMVDEIGIASSRKHANAGNIGFSAETGVEC